MRLLLLSLILIPSWYTSGNRNLIEKEWYCDSRDYAGAQWIIRDQESMEKMMKESGAYCGESAIHSDSIDFSKHSVLAVFVPAQSYCHATYYRKVTFDEAFGQYIFSLVTNGIGGCRHEAIASVQFVLVPKLRRYDTVKFRTLYRGNSYGEEMKQKEADRILDGPDAGYDNCVIVEK